MNDSKKTLVLGASDNPARYSNIAMERLKSNGHPVLAVGRKETTAFDIPIHKHLVEDEGVDTITLYLNPRNQVEYYDYIMKLKPKRIIFNPGTENNELMTMARNAGIQPVVACTLVMLATGQY